jgi:hypothetical protein
LTGKAIEHSAFSILFLMAEREVQPLMQAIAKHPMSKFD